MRVIHSDGRVGSVVRYHYRLPKPYEVRFIADGSDKTTYQRVRAGDLRPLGPIEEELRSSECVDKEVGLDCIDWSDETCRLWNDCMDGMGEEYWADACIDADSEALEACARIWERHGVAL